MTSRNELPRERLLSSLKGNSVVLPDMQALLRDWPQYVNPEIETLHTDVEKYLEMYTILINVDREAAAHSMPRLFPPGCRLRKMKAANAALFASSWWPYASFETLRIAAYLSIWVNIIYPEPRS